MKALKIVLYILAAIIFFAGALSLFTIPLAPEKSAVAYKIGYYLGVAIFFIIPVILFLVARSIGKKKKKTPAQDLLDSLPH
jgi:hypothetical protein